MKFLTICLFFVMISIAILGCGKSDTIELERPPIDRGVDDLNPDPEDPSDPDDPDDPTDPEDPPETVVLLIEGRALDVDETDGLILPYKDGLVKPLALGKTVKSKKCSKKYKKKCVKNKHVIFGFDIDLSEYDPSIYRVREIKLTGSYYSIGKNYRSELLCLLNLKLCSGRAVVKIPRWGLSFIVKLFLWNKKFWRAGHEKIVRSQLFHQILEAGYIKEDKIYIRKNIELNFRGLFGMTSENMDDLAYGTDRIDFTVTDDTFVENPKLEIVLVPAKSSSISLEQ